MCTASFPFSLAACDEWHTRRRQGVGTSEMQGEETGEATVEKLHGSTNLIVQAVVLRRLEEPREVDLKEEQVLSRCGMPSATLSQGHGLTDPLTR